MEPLDLLADLGMCVFIVFCCVCSEFTKPGRKAQHIFPERTLKRFESSRGEGGPDRSPNRYFTNRRRGPVRDSLEISSIAQNVNRAYFESGLGDGCIPYRLKDLEWPARMSGAIAPSAGYNSVLLNSLSTRPMAS